MLDREVLANPAVAGMINDRFVSFKINADRGEGRALKKKFQVHGYPTVVLVDSKTGEEIDRITGFSPPELYLLLIGEYLSGKNYGAIRKKALAHPGDVEIWYNYAEKLEERDEGEARKAWKKVASLDPEDEKGRGGLALYKIARMENSPASLLEVAVKFKGRPAALAAHGSLVELLKSSSKKRDEKQVMTSYRYILQHNEEDTDALDEYARYLLAHGGSPDEALRMAGKAVKIEPGMAEYLDTLAECYFRLGQKELAVAAAREALEVAERKKWAFYERRLEELKAKDPPKKK